MMYLMTKTFLSRIRKSRRRSSIITTRRRIKSQIRKKSLWPRMWASSAGWNPYSMVREETTKIALNSRVTIFRLLTALKTSWRRAKRRRVPERIGTSSATTSKNGEPKSISSPFQTTKPKSPKRSWATMPTNRSTSSIWSKMVNRRRKRTSLVFRQ